jgi:hypothetical protein
MKYLTALFLLISTSLSHSTDLAVEKLRRPLTCSTVREFVMFYGEHESMKRAKEMGLPVKTIDYIIRTCFSREAKQSK